MAAIDCHRQVGVNDFHLENIGNVKSAKFHADTQRKRVYFSTVSCSNTWLRDAPAQSFASTNALTRHGNVWRC